MRASLRLMGIVLLAGCGQDATGAIEALAPKLGKADSADQADRSCQVVLRSVARRMGSGGYETQCTGGVCNFVWDGSVAIANGQFGTVRVLYRLANDPSWWQVDASPAAGSQPGFTRYDFSIHEHLFGPAAPGSTIELVPVLELADGTRLFDHNRRPGDFDNYRLEASTDFALGDDGSCAPASGHIAFLGNWDEYASGELRQDGYLVIDYSLDRLTTCRGTHNGYPAWDIVAHARFLPGGQEETGSVREFDSVQGVPTSTAHAKTLTLPIPAGATSVEIWFENFTGAGSTCEAWDSNLGKNYVYEVWPPASDPRCKDVERWATQASDMPYKSSPYCLGYDVDQNLDANGCEVFASGIGNGVMSHYGIPNHWVEAYLAVGPQQGTVLGAGLWVRYRDAAGKAPGERVVIGREVAPGTWQTGFIYDKPGYMGSGGYYYDVEAMAFFVDVQRPTGQVVRLWQSRHGANYSWSDAFSGPTSTTSIPYGNILYAGEGAGIFDAEHACGH